MKKSQLGVVALPVFLAGCFGGDNAPTVNIPLSEDPVVQVDSLTESIIAEENFENLVEELKETNPDAVIEGNLDEFLEDATLSGDPEAEVTVETLADPNAEVEIVVETETTPEPTATETEEEAPAPPAPTEEQTTLNGSFAYPITYATPKGNTEVRITFGVKNGVIEGITLVGNAKHGTSIQYQKRIEAELGNLVVGKEAVSVQALPSKVSGSSLTPTAFNGALAKLQAEA